MLLCLGTLCAGSFLRWAEEGAAQWEGQKELSTAVAL